MFITCLNNIFIKVSHNLLIEMSQIRPYDTDVDINSSSNSKKLDGRPKNAVWQHFECYPSKHPGHLGAKCKACNCE